MTKNKAMVPPPENSSPLLKLEGLQKSYGALKATNNLDMEIKKGHIHALIGPNGAGKTTAVNQITGDIFPDRGRIFFKDQEVTRKKVYTRARMGMARSFQITHIFDHLSVAENMALAICANNGHNFKFWKKSLDSALVRQLLPQALVRVNLEERSHLAARHLSHGEKRQLEVGMALVGKPDLLIMDEPMAGMGPGGTVEMTRLIQKLKGELTILLVEHDMDVVFSLADQVTVLVYGENIATGSPEAIRKNEAVCQAYLGQAGLEEDA